MDSVSNKDKIKGIIFMVLSSFSFASMGMFVKLAGDLPTMEKCLFRNGIALIVAAFMVVRSGKGLQIQKGTFKYYMGRALCGTVGVIGNFYAVDHLILADASMLNKMSPFFAVLFSVIILKDKISPKQWICLAIAFSGLLFVIKPSAENIQIIPYIVGFTGGVGAGLSHTFLRKLGEFKANKYSIIFVFSVMTTLVSLPFAIINYKPMTSYQFWILLVGGICGAMGQICLTTAYSYAPPKDISIFDYSMIIFSAIWGFFLFKQIPDALSFVGYVVICGAAFGNYMIGKRKAS